MRGLGASPDCCRGMGLRGGRGLGEAALMCGENLYARSEPQQRGGETSAPVCPALR